MACNKEDDVGREKAISGETGFGKFLIKKDAFETSLEGLTLSAEERERLNRALEFGFVAGQQTIIYYVVDGDEHYSKHMLGVYNDVVNKLKTGSYVRGIPQKQTGDDDEPPFGD